jgi:hypothetical protein
MNNTSTLNANSLVASTTLVSVDNKSYSMIVPRFSYIKPSGTNVSVSYRGIDEGMIFDDTYVSVTTETENERIDKMRTILSHSNEVSVIAGAKSSRFNITISSADSYISPVVDMVRKSSLIIKNIVNNDSTNEDTRYGNAFTRYMNAPITLADGQDAEDILVYLSAFRPVGTNIEVYAKILNGSDSNDFTSKVWTKLTNNDSSLYSSTTNRKDFREFEFAFPTAVGVTSSAFKNLSNSGIVQYTRADGALFQGYKTFAIKIVMLSSSEANVPMVDDARAICLQV